MNNQEEIYLSPSKENVFINIDNEWIQYIRADIFSNLIKNNMVCQHVWGKNYNTTSANEYCLKCGIEKYLEYKTF